MTEPFILKARVSVSEGAEPDQSQIYDPRLQLWVNKITGAAVVTGLNNCIEASQFGETTMTKTSGEGSDRSSEVVHLMSQFGETTMTETREGVDSTESTAVAQYVIDSFV